MRRSAVALGLISGVAVIVFGLAMTRGPSPSGAGRFPSRAIAPPDAFCGGILTTLDDVRQNAPYPVLLPSGPLANASNVKDVCWDPSPVHGVSMKFTSGIFYEISPNAFADPEGAWKQIIAAYPGAGYALGAVRGYPALLAEPGGTLNLLGLVEWVENGLQIKVEGNGKIPLAGLEAIAESLSGHN